MEELLSPDGTRLALHDFGGSGEPVLLVPGLCGYAGEWSAVASWLTRSHRVYALDPRGHGDSERRPVDVSRDANVADTETALRRIGPAVLIGQSMGGHTAMLTAARHPALLTRLVLVEAGPKGHDGDASGAIDRWLADWESGFADLATAAEYLGGGLVGKAWAGGLRQREGRWVAAFDRHVMVDTIAMGGEPRWEEFARIACPTLVVKGEKGFMDADEYERMRDHPMVAAVEITGAGHDVHLDSPEQFRAAVSGFLLAGG